MSDDYLHHKHSNIHTVHFKQTLLVCMKELDFQNFAQESTHYEADGMGGNG